jgi:dTDP-4-amino-4,6-dideoxygalactose transaminase
MGARDAAIVPAMTFLATANVVRMVGAEVVFADVDPDTGLLTAATLEAACMRGKAAGLTVKATLPVHLNGQLCDMGALAGVCRDRGVLLIEDACHSLGVKNVGAAEYSIAACFSTHPVKAIATGEGGMVTTRDAGRAARMRRLRSHGMVRDAADFENRDLGFEETEANPWYYEMHELGWNYRLPDVLCALGISQLRKLAKFRRRRLEIATLYDRLLAPLAPAIRPVPHDERHGWHLYAVLIDFASLGTTRARAMRRLQVQGIGTQVHYVPVHRQPYYRRRYGSSAALPGADAYYARCLSVPLFPAMGDGDVQRVADALARL